MNVQDEIKALKERIAELEKQEFPRIGDKYWYLGDTGEILYENWDNVSFEEDRLGIGNVFKTEDEAKFAKKKLKVEAELRKFSRPFADGEENNHIKYSPSFDELSVLTSFSYQDQGVFYFESEEKVQQAIKSVGEDRIKKYIFGVGE